MGVFIGFDPQGEALRVADRDALRRERARIEAETEVMVRQLDESFIRRARLPRVWLAFLLKAAGLYRRGARNAWRIQVEERNLHLPSLPEGLDGLRVLHLSDIHFNGCPDFVDHVARKVADARADVCVMTGDFRDELRGPCDSVVEGLTRLIPAISAPLGVYGVLGNHDPGRLADEVRPRGLNILFNEGVELRHNGSSFWLGGVDDPHKFRGAHVPFALEGRPDGSFTLLMAHSPEAAADAAECGVDLYLCGHTHGGQVCLPLLGAVTVNARCSRRLGSGPWTVGRTLGYTSRGVGSTEVPVRFNCPPEVAVLTLRGGSEAGPSVE